MRRARFATVRKILDFYGKVKSNRKMTQWEWLQQRMTESFSDECVEWPFRQLAQGYGYVRVAKKKIYAHRYACAQHGQPTGTRWQAAHSCGNRLCINPNHLRWATPQENVDDTKRMGRTRKGEDHPFAELSKCDVLEIRELYASGALFQREIAQRFGISDEHVSAITRGSLWASEGGPRVVHESQDWSPKGEDVAQAKLTKEQVAEMRRLYNNDEATQIELAYRFGLTMAATNRILTGKSYVDGFDPIALSKRTHAYRTPRTFTKEQIQDICKRYEDGETQGEIAKSFDMQSASIGRVLKRQGLK
jgi:hypothetical protein